MTIIAILTGETPGPLPKDKGPIFIPKSSGLGWTLNFERTESYWILGATLAFALVYVLFKKKVIRL